jgi:hypothetical protein
MKRRSFLCSSAAFVGAGMLASDDGQADNIHPRRVHAASLMTECANRFLAALDAISAVKRPSRSIPMSA